MEDPYTMVYTMQEGTHTQNTYVYATTSWGDGEAKHLQFLKVLPMDSVSLLCPMAFHILELVYFSFHRSNAFNVA